MSHSVNQKLEYTWIYIKIYQPPFIASLSCTIRSIEQTLEKTKTVGLSKITLVRVSIISQVTIVVISNGQKITCKNKMVTI